MTSLRALFPTLAFLAWLSLPLQAGAAAAEPRTGVDWLRLMRQAAATLSYQGVVAYIKDQQVDSFKLYHQVADGQERERLVAMNSPYREVLRVGGNVSRYSSEGQQVVVETRPSNQSVLLNLPEDPTVVERYYRVNLRGQEYVAGFLSQVVALEPRDGYRYSRLFWIDTSTRLPLKVDVLDEDGRSVEQMVFTTLNARDPIPRQDLEPSPRTAMAMTRISHRESRPLDSLGWTLRQVPDGFQIVSYSILKRPSVNAAVEHILLSDGFSPISIYIEPSRGKMPAGSRKLGAISVDTREIDGHTATIMGEAPLKTVEQIAKGLQQR